MTSANTILIVDDDPIGREALMAALMVPDFSFALAGSGLEAIEQATTLLPDLILLDVMMPGMDGYEVCSRIRSDPLLADVPIVMVTALNDRASRLKGLEVGADDFISKPVDLVELRARVHTIMRLNRYRRLFNERTRFQWVVEQADAGYLLLDASDKIVFANATASRFLDLPEEEVLATAEPFLNLVYKSFSCMPEEAWAHWSIRPFLETNDPLYLVRPESPFASGQWLQLRILDQPDGPQSLRLVRAEDVTAQMSERRSMWNFHSMVRHKLSTPLNILSLCMDSLSQQPLPDLETHGIAQFIDCSVDATDRLSETVSQILHYLDMPLRAQSEEGFALRKLPGHG